jgi:hypothetical protein
MVMFSFETRRHTIESSLGIVVLQRGPQHRAEPKHNTFARRSRGCADEGIRCRQTLRLGAQSVDQLPGPIRRPILRSAGDVSID